jgi:hypothetical protein
MSPRTRSLLLSLGLLGPACTQAGAPCYGTTCGSGYECLANRCAPSGGIPVPRDAERVVLFPTELSAVSDGRVQAAPGVTLGGDGDGDALVYARFGSSYKGRAEIAAAFLLLTISPGTEPAPDVPLEVWRLSASWSPETVSRGARPPFSHPMARGIARTTPPLPVRIDVTSIVRELARGAADDGVGIAAKGAHGPGVTLVTAAAGAPRLEVYLDGWGRTASAW